MFDPIHDEARSRLNLGRFHSTFFDDLTEAQSLIIDATILSAPSSHDIFGLVVNGFGKANKLARWSKEHEAEQFLVLLSVFISIFDSWRHVDEGFCLKLRHLTNEPTQEFLCLGLALNEKEAWHTYWLNVAKRWHDSLQEYSLKLKFEPLFLGPLLSSKLSDFQMNYLTQYAKFFTGISPPEIRQYLAQSDV
jgi:hypothetical protein